MDTSWINLLRRKLDGRSRPRRGCTGKHSWSRAIHTRICLARAVVSLHWDSVRNLTENLRQLVGRPDRYVQETTSGTPATGPPKLTPLGCHDPSEDEEGRGCERKSERTVTDHRPTTVSRCLNDRRYQLFNARFLDGRWSLPSFL